MKSKVSTEINYISLINWFWENIPFLDGYKPDYGILFLAITDSINHSRWSENVPIPYDRITSKSCLSKRAYLDGRKWLKENKLIDFACGKNEYAMATFSLGSEVRNCTATNTAIVTATDTAAVSSTAPLLTPLLAPSIINNKQETIKQETIENDIKEVVSFLNDKIGSSFKPDTSETKKLLSARLKKYSVEDCKKVIDTKVSDWFKNKDFKKYLRPSTLFNESKFESYLNEAKEKISAFEISNGNATYKTLEQQQEELYRQRGYIQ